MKLINFTILIALFPAVISFVFLSGRSGRKTTAVLDTRNPLRSDSTRIQNAVLSNTAKIISFLGIAAATAQPNSAHAYGAVEVPKKKKEGKVKVLETNLGIKYIDVKLGEGPMPSSGDIVVINYLAFLSNGTEFDSIYSKKGLSFK